MTSGRARPSFLACLEARDRFRGESSLRTYLFGIANNLPARRRTIVEFWESPVSIFEEIDGNNVPEGFGRVTSRERREADRFFAELRGRPRRLPRARRRFPESWPFAESVPEQRLPRRQGGLAERCGFIGPAAVLRSETELRTAVVAAAVAERNAWLDAGTLRRENDDAIFGRLVRYYLSVIRDARPDTLVAMQTTAVGATNYGQLVAQAATQATLATEAARVRGLLFADAPGTTTPTNLGTLVQSKLLHARQGRLSRGAWSAWSAVWVSMVVRGAGISLGLEAFTNPVHHGRDKLLLPTAAHRIYTLEAYNRRQRREAGTYHAFDPTLRAPALGDIIVQDRQARSAAAAFTYANVPSLSSGRQTHGDIVVAVEEGSVVTIGGNVGNGVRRRRYPLGDNGRLVVDVAQLYTQENDRGVLPAVPATSTQGLHARSTRRIFALLSPVIECAVIPGQRVGGGVLV